MSIDEAITFLSKAKKQLGGDASLVLCLANSGIEDVTINEMKIIQYDETRYVEVLVHHPIFGESA